MTSKDYSQEANKKAEGAADQAQEKASQLASQAKEQASSQLSKQKERATGQLDSISSALHQTTGNLRKENQEPVANYVEKAAHQVDHFSDYLRTHSASELVSEVKRYARRDPSLFLGGAMLVGLAGARFFKSSASKQQRRHSGPPPRRNRYETHPTEYSSGSLEAGEGSRTRRGDMAAPAAEPKSTAPPSGQKASGPTSERLESKEKRR